MIKNQRIYGLEESLKASKFPMAINTDNCTSDATNTTYNLMACDIGTGHDNFLNGIVVQFDLTFSNKAWVEMQRYHFIDFVSSQSTMHKITSMDLNKSCNAYVDNRIKNILQEMIDDYNKLDMYDKNTDMGKNKYLTILYNIPSGFQLTARMTTNYRQLKTIYNQRKNHRLPEWRLFCKWIETLPYMKDVLKLNS